MTDAISGSFGQHICTFDMDMRFHSASLLLAMQESDEPDAGICQAGVQWARRRHPSADRPQWEDL